MKVLSTLPVVFGLQAVVNAYPAFNWAFDHSLGVTDIDSLDVDALDAESETVEAILPRGHPPIAKRASAGPWQAPAAGDERGPCPALNSLANHGAINRDGKGLTSDILVRGITDVLGISESVSKTLAFGAMKLNTTAKKSPTIGLNLLNVHNLAEHDVSLAHVDAYFGNPFVPNDDLVQELTNAPYAENGVVTEDNLGKFRRARYQDSKANNPELKFDAVRETLAFTESGFLVNVLGNPDHDYDLKTSYLKAFLGDQRLPYEEGWTKRAKPIGMGELLKHSHNVKSAAGWIGSRKA